MTNPWLDLNTTRPPFVLDIDRAAVDAHNRRNTSRPQYQFETESMLPEPFLGRTAAPVVLLTGNPRFRDDDLETHRRADVRAHLSAMLGQEPLGLPLVWLDPQLKDTSGAKWYRSRLRELIEACGGEDAVAHNVAVYESLPYHSRELGSVHTPIPSQRYTDTLVREALDQARIIIWQRGTAWRAVLGAAGPSRENVIRPRAVMSSYLSRRNLGEGNFERVIEAITG